MSLMAQLPTTVSASFGLDLERLRGLGITDPRSTDAMKILQSGQLGSDERLFLSLWGSKHLNTAFFEPKKRIFKAGAAVEEAYIVTSGSVVALSSGKVFRFGPGSVLGLAEGLMNKPSEMTVVTTTTVQAKVIPFHKIDSVIAKLPSEVKAILETILKRTLAIN